MSARYDTTERFFRPADVATLRRNQRRIQIQQIILVGTRLLVVGAFVAAGIWTWRHTHSGARFALQSIEVTGAVHTPRAALDGITRSYVGANLFDLDISRVQNDLRQLGWVSRVEAEKKLPGTLRVRVVERTPVALLQAGDRLHYVDERGVAFAELSPQVGDSDLPLITNAGGAELARCVAFLRSLRAQDMELYARVSELRPVAPDAFALFDRQLGAVVYANANDFSSKWRELYAIAQAEGLGRAEIAYADLRFADRIVIKPLNAVTLSPHSEPQGVIHAED